MAVVGWGCIDACGTRLHSRHADATGAPVAVNRAAPCGGRRGRRSCSKRMRQASLPPPPPRPPAPPPLLAAVMSRQEDGCGRASRNATRPLMMKWTSLWSKARACELLRRKGSQNAQIKSNRRTYKRARRVKWRERRGSRIIGSGCGETRRRKTPARQDGARMRPFSRVPPPSTIHGGCARRWSGAAPFRRPNACWWASTVDDDDDDG